MSESGKITASHLSRAAVIYVRQSTLAQVERNTESTARQYDLAARAGQLGWPVNAIRVVDGDLGVSGSVTAASCGCRRARRLPIARPRSSRSSRSPSSRSTGPRRRRPTARSKC